MDFFQAQDQARRNTGWLVILFMLAIIALVVITNVMVIATLGFVDHGSTASLAELSEGFDWDIFFMVGGGVSVVILLGSFYKILQLSGGGHVVAEMLGGNLVNTNSSDPDMRRVLNVVEEMAVASGTPVPPVYLLKGELGINAFAAGFSPSDAVIGITQGSAIKLSREELQGVIAHEFSHILNGDMRLNIRLIGVLNGILLLGDIGYYLMRGGGRSRNGGSVAMLGLGIMAVGFAGTFFGNLIKATINRQREYLADASAVQFTRNPASIAGALKKIGAAPFGSALNSPVAPEMSHAYFATGISSFFTSMFSTHPPLEERIRRVDPSWDGVYPLIASPVTEEPAAAVSQKAGSQEKMAAATAVASAVVVDAINHYGQPGEAHIDYARDLIKTLPETLTAAVHEPFGARAIIYCLVINKQEHYREQQLKLIAQQGDVGIHALVQQLLPLIDDLPAHYRLPLIDIALPVLRQLSSDQYLRFQLILKALIAADDKMSLFEWSLNKITWHYLGDHFGKGQHMFARQTTLEQQKPACALLLSVLIHSEKAAPLDAQTAFSTAQLVLGLQGMSLFPKSAIKLSALDKAITTLANIKPSSKQLLLKACVACITSDGHVSSNETELLRAFADSLGCPLPPIIDPV